MPLNDLLIHRAFLHYIDTELVISEFKDHNMSLLWTILGSVMNVLLPAVYGLDAAEVAIYFLLEIWYVKAP